MIDVIPLPIQTTCLSPAPYSTMSPSRPTDFSARSDSAHAGILNSIIGSSRGANLDVAVSGLGKGIAIEAGGGHAIFWIFEGAVRG